MKPAWLPLAIERGTRWPLRLVWTNPDGTPVAMPGWAASLYIWRRPNDAAPLLEIPGTVGAADGSLVFEMAPEEIAGIAVNEAVHAIVVMDPAHGPLRLADGPVDFLAPGQRPKLRAGGGYPALPGSEPGAAVVAVSDTEVRVVSVAMQGPAGPAGPGGGDIDTDWVLAYAIAKL